VPVRGSGHTWKGLSGVIVANASKEAIAMTLTVLDPRTGRRVTINVPQRPRTSRARRWVLAQLDRTQEAADSQRG